MITILSFSIYGKDIGENLKLKIDNSEHLNSSDVDFKLKDYVKDNWNNRDGFIFISSTGIAIRYIKDLITTKDKDPAIVVVDDMGRNAISLLSGHLGGANELTREVARILDANPVITTSTDNHGIEAVDEFSRKLGYKIADKSEILPISKMMLEDKKIGFYSKYPEIIDYKNVVRVENLENIPDDIDGLIVVSDKKRLDFKIPSIWLYPKTLYLGIGCRKDIKSLDIINFVERIVDELGYSKYSIAKIGTVEVKRYEQGMIEAAEYFNVERQIFSNKEIETVEDKFNKSEFVKKTIGVYSVAEPSAYLLCKNIILERVKENGITLAISVKEN